jgi:hypothetical protein
MKRRIILTLLVAGLFVIIHVMSHATISAQSGGTYDLTWITIDGGGAMNLAGGTYTLSGTVGQFDAGAQSGGTYALNGGFWANVQAVADTIKIYLPMILKAQ